MAEHYRRWALILSSMLQRGAQIADAKYDPAKLNPPPPPICLHGSSGQIKWPLRSDKLRFPRNSDELLSSQSHVRCCRFTPSYILQRKQPQPRRYTSNPGGFSKLWKRPRDNFKETRTHGGDDDESDGSTAEIPPGAQSLRTRGISHAKQLRIEADLTRSSSFYRLA